MAMYVLARIAQLVERWSNKPLVLGSIPNVSKFFWDCQNEICANRESNPALKLGKLQCYRYTIGAGRDLNGLLCHPSPSASLTKVFEGRIELPTFCV